MPNKFVIFTAVGYGVYDFVPYMYRTSGYVAIWSIKVSELKEN